MFAFGKGDGLSVRQEQVRRLSCIISKVKLEIAHGPSFESTIEKGNAPLVDCRSGSLFLSGYRKGKSREKGEESSFHRDILKDVIDCVVWGNGHWT